MTRITRVSILVPLRHRSYRILFSGQVISNIGDWLDILALVALLLYRWELGAGAWGGVLTALTLPYALLGPIAGVWVDRWQPRTVMVVCDLARAVLALGLVWAPDLASVLVLVTVSSVFSTFHLPAQQAMIRHTVPDEDLLAANALGQLADNGARLLGPALGGLAVVAGGARFAFLLDALTFVISALLLSRLPNTTTEREAGAHHNFRFELRAGLVHIGQTRPLLVGVSAMVIAGWLIRSTDTLSAIVLKALGVGEGMQGLSSTALGVGYVVGALVVGQWGARVPALVSVGIGMVIVGGNLAAVGVAAAVDAHGTMVLVLTAFVGRTLIGMGFASMSVAYGYLLQSATPAAMIGRVTATSRALVTGIPLLAPFLATVAADRWGLGSAYAAFGTGLLVLGGVVIGLQHRKWGARRRGQ